MFHWNGFKRIDYRFQLKLGIHLILKTNQLFLSFSLRFTVTDVDARK
jgi:hypothetical protein